MATNRVGVIGAALARGDGGFNAPYSWHMISSTVEFPDVMKEHCDGLPSYVEQHLDEWLAEHDRFCPWAARVIEEIV
jgi:hypothetical protein